MQLMADERGNGLGMDSHAVTAYEQLKRMIIELELPPGTALTEPALVTRLGIGRTPVREALRRLADEHLLMIFPRRGMVVAHLGLAEVQQLFEARLTIEGQNAELAAARASSVDDDELAQLGEAVHAAQDEDSFRAFLKADGHIHHAIARIARNTFLRAATNRILTLNAWLWHAQLDRYGIEPSDYASHDAIIRAIARRDPAGARSAMVQHIESSREILRVTL